MTPTLALTLGLRYENFGQPANSLPYPAFSGFDPAQFLVRHEVHRRQQQTSDRLSAWRGRPPGARAGWENCSATEKRSGAEDIRSATTPCSRR